MTISKVCFYVERGKKRLKKTTYEYDLVTRMFTNTITNTQLVRFTQTTGTFVPVTTNWRGLLKCNPYERNFKDCLLRHASEITPMEIMNKLQIKLDENTVSTQEQQRTKKLIAEYSTKLKKVETTKQQLQTCIQKCEKHLESLEN